MRHGGGRRCAVEGCGCVAQTGSSVCLKHGGGKKCSAPACSRSVPIINNFCLQHRGTCIEEGCQRTRASEMTDRCVLHGGGKVGVPMCQVEGCEVPALKGQELCRVHAPKRSRRGMSPGGLPLDALHQHYGFTFPISGFTKEEDDGEEFLIDIGEGSGVNTPPTPELPDQPVTSQIDHAHLLSLLQFTQPTLAD